MSFYVLRNIPYPPEVPTDNSDKFGSSRYIFSIGEYTSGHIMQFPAFVESIKYNTTKEMDYQSETDKWTKVIKEYTGDFIIEVKLNLPAGSPQQAKTNVAKLENLQKLLLNPYYAVPDFGSSDFQTAIANEQKSITGPLFKVSFANLIHGGKNDLEGTGFAGGILENGFPCTIESINFSPLMEMGFFEFEDIDLNYEFLYPKMLTLDLSLKIEVQNEKMDFVPLRSFDVKKFLYDDNAYPNDNRDAVVFPFGLRSSKEDYKQAYTISKKLAYNRNYYILLSRLGVNVVFPAFIDGFNRNFEVTQNYIESKSNYIGKGTDTGKLTTPSKLSYKLDFSVPCASIEESKVFAKEIQSLMRMFYRQTDDSEYGLISSFRVYVPGFIESDFDSTTFSSVGNQENDQSDSMEDGVLTIEASSDVGLEGLWMEDLSIEIENDMGFFEHQGCLWPKSYKISTSFVSDMTLGYIQPHKIITRRSQAGEEPSITTNTMDFFPFNRDTLTIGDE